MTEKQNEAIKKEQENLRRTKKSISDLESQIEAAVTFDEMIDSLHDSFDTLKRLCKEKADALVKSFSDQEVEDVVVTFWTEGFPELICVAQFSKNENKEVVYNLDFSQTTL